LPHLLERIGNVKRANFLTILEFQELVAAMTRHVDKYVRPVICKQAL
jgi:hypothetical protein